MSKKQTFLSFILACFFIFTIAQVAENEAHFVAMCIFLIVPVVAGLSLVMIAKALISYFTKPKHPAHRYIEEQAVPNERIAKAKSSSVMQGDEIMFIPAYARKEKGFMYPITPSVLKNGLVIR